MKKIPYNKLIFTKASLKIAPSILSIVLLITIITKDYASIGFPVCWIILNMILFFLIDLVVIFFTEINSEEER